jgi:hypothetical protein
MIRLADMDMSGDRESGSKIIRKWHVDTEDEIFLCLAQNSVYRGAMATGKHSARVWDPDTIESGFEVSIEFGSIEGIEVGFDGDQGSEYGGREAKWSFEPSFQQTAIEKHPDINELIENYGGEEDPQTHRVTFRRILQSADFVGPVRDARGLLGKNSRDSDGNLLNPLFGFNESGYITMTGIASARFLTSNVSNVLADVGTIFEQLPENAPDFGVASDRNWLKMPPSVNEAAREEDGSIWYEVQAQFMLSEKGGWPPAVYKFIEI